VQVALFLVQPGQVGLVIGLAVLAGIAVAAAHVLPDAIFPDVIDWDEVRTHQRREGTYYGIKNFARKLTGAIAIFVALQTLGWAGYQAPAAGLGRGTQSQATLTVIRLLMGPLPALLIVAAAITALVYPLTRERHRRIQRVLERRAARRARRS